MAASILRWIDELAFAWKGGVVHCPPNAVRRGRDNWEMGDAVLVDRRRNPRRVHVCRDEPMLVEMVLHGQREWPILT